ncbi:TolC family protein [bacterium]|nr:TolC family protein [bacterium]
MRKWRYGLAIVTASLVTANLFGQENNVLVLTLDQCEELAFKNNPAVHDAQLSLDISRAKLKQARNARFLPKFELSNVWGPIPKARAELRDGGGYAISPDTSTGLSDLRYFTQLDIDILQPIYTFGKISSLTDAALFGVAADEAKVVSERESVRLKVRQIYWGLLLATELLGVIQDADAELTKAENRVEEKLDEGSDEVSQTDLYKLQLFRYEINKRLREAKDKVTLGKSAIKLTIGLAEEEADITMASEYLDPVKITLDSLTTYIEMAGQHRPELARLRSGIQAKRALVNMQRSDYYPQFFLGAQISLNRAPSRDDPKNPFIHNPTNFFRPGIVVGAKWNLNFWQTRSKVGVAQAEFLHLAQKEEQLSHGLKLEVEKSYLELVQAQQNMQDSRKALRTSNNWLRSATMTFDIGVGEVKELIDAFKANGAMEAEHLGNILKFNLAAAKLSQVTGRNLVKN